MADKPYRRVTAYPRKLTLQLSEAQHRALADLAGKRAWPIAHAARECLAAGLPAVRRRRAARRPSP